MPNNYSGRIVTILVVLYLALSSVFNRVPGSLSWVINGFPPVSFKPNLKPGIDMVGGTSLLYQIKTAPGQVPAPDLANQVMESLKKRVDPQGVRNLIWRPQGATRIEIQMPLTQHNDNAAKIREEFGAAQRGVEATNVRPAAVTDAVENLKGDERAKRLAELAMGYPARAKLFAEMVSTYDAMAAARAARDVEQDVVLDKKYEELKGRIEDTNLPARMVQDTNLPARMVQDVLDLKKDAREAKLAEIMGRNADFPARVAALKDFEAKYLAYAAVRNSIDDSAELKRLLRGSGVLEFHILVDNYGTPEAQVMLQRLAKSGPVVQSGDTMRWYVIDHPEDWHHESFPYNDKRYALAYTTPDKQMVNGPGIQRWSLQRASMGQDQNGKPAVNFEFDTIGALYFGQLTGNNINRPLATILDERIITAPNINSKIGAVGTITGNFSNEEIKYLVSTLSAGSLPAQLSEEPISERTVGPQLGEANLRNGLVSCFVGLLAVGVFLVFYYHMAGTVALFALCLNIVIIVGVMSLLEATWTLPAVAGIVLTIGAAVDANVLIFERLREEQHRGLSLPMAMRNAYDRAFSAILDSNMTTAITSVVLIMLGTEEVKGFGLTLLLGILSSLFTALFVTKTIFGIWIEYFGLKRLGSLPQSLPAIERALHPQFNWMRWVPVFLAISVVLTVAGLGSLYVKAKQGEMFDIEFASGTSVQFDLTEPMTQPDVEKVVRTVDERLIPSPSVVPSGTDGKQYEVLTPNANAQEVRQALVTAFGDKMAIEKSSNYVAKDQPFEKAVDAGVVMPVPDDGKLPPGVPTPPDSATYRGGAAIVLKDLQPQLSPDEIKRRIDRQQLQPTAGGETPRYRDYELYSPGGDKDPTSVAVILVADPGTPYASDAAKWREELAGPMWRLVNDAVGRTAPLQKVTNFDAQVAGDAQRDALMALALSNVIILAYIWVRFGNFKYGIATVAAMIHDTVLVVGFVGLSHYLAHNVIGHVLLIEPFRVNLTLVAAILTVMGYSMIDTIVIFDRIRENRGKIGYLNKRVINDSVNQTLSRTILTVGTTMLTVTVMYIFGGPAIHGFAFVLLAGILIGTYSSIAVAAPILLMGEAGQAKDEAGTGLTRANHPAASAGRA